MSGTSNRIKKIKRKKENRTDPAQEQATNNLQHFYNEEEAVALTPAMRRLLEVSNPKESEIIPPPPSIVNLTVFIVSAQGFSLDTATDKELEEHFGEAYRRWIEKHGRIRGRYKFWRDLINSSPGKEAQGVIRKALLILKILLFFLKGKF